MKRDNRLYFHLNRATHHLRKTVDRLSLEAVGASSAQIGALFLIRERNGCTQNEIAAEFGQDESAVTTMLTRMEREALVERKPNPADGRSKLVYITDHGAELLKNFRPLLNRFNSNLTADFSEDEIEIILRFLKQAPSLTAEDLTRP